jgi:hypothetical protein
MTTKNAIFCDVTPCGSHKNRRLEGMCRLNHYGDIVFLRRVLELVVTANAVPSLPILVTLTMEAIRSSETSVLATVIRRKIPEDRIL